MKKTKADIAALYLSIISLVVSSIAAYLAGPYSNIELSVVYEGRQWEYSISKDEFLTDFNLTFINTGNKPIAITAISMLLTSHEGMEACSTFRDITNGILVGKNNVVLLAADYGEFVPFVLKSNEIETKLFKYKAPGGASEETKNGIINSKPAQKFCTSILVNSVAPGFGADGKIEPVSLGLIGRVNADYIIEEGGGEPQGNIITFRRASKLWQ